MASTDNFYTKSEVLVEFPHKSGAIRIIIGQKLLRGEPKTYLDIRTWYPYSEHQQLVPGKGFAKPIDRENLYQIGTALCRYAETMDK